MIKSIQAASGWISIAVLYAALALEITVKYPCNHGGGVGGYWLGLTASAAVNAAIAFKTRRIPVAVVLSIAAYAAILWACDFFNVLIPYEIWIDRQMPEWGAIGVAQ